MSVGLALPGAHSGLKADIATSEKCQTEKSGGITRRSALPSRSDIVRSVPLVRFVPVAELANASTMAGIERSDRNVEASAKLFELGGT